MGDGYQKRFDEIRVGDVVLSDKTPQPVNVLAVENQDYPTHGQTPNVFLKFFFASGSRGSYALLYGYSGPGGLSL